MSKKFKPEEIISTPGKQRATCNINVTTAHFAVSELPAATPWMRCWIVAGVPDLKDVEMHRMPLHHMTFFLLQLSSSTTFNLDQSYTRPPTPGVIGAWTYPSSSMASGPSGLSSLAPRFSQTSRFSQPRRSS